jgi:hypothetical protein
MTDPRSQALAYRIWGYADPREWDVTLAEVADALGEPVPAVRAVIVSRQWANRMRRPAQRTAIIQERSGMILDIKLEDDASWI